MERKEYVRQVVRRLQCSPKKKREIEKQLDSHIGIGLGEGCLLYTSDAADD